MLVPYMVRISIFYRENYPRAWLNTLRIYCMTDDKAEKVRRGAEVGGDVGDGWLCVTVYKRDDTFPSDSMSLDETVPVLRG
jgi:hypothetical protein